MLHFVKCGCSTLKYSTYIISGLFTEKFEDAEPIHRGKIKINLLWEAQDFKSFSKNL